MTVFHSAVGRLAVAVAVLLIAAPAAFAGERGTAEEAQAMVADAIAYDDEVGAEAMIERFNNDPGSEFRDGDLYIFLFGPDDTIVAHAVDGSLLGDNIADYVDVDGKRFGEEMLATKSSDGVWVDYKWIDPSTGGIDPKSSWLVEHDGHLFAAGIYKP